MNVKLHLLFATDLFKGNDNSMIRYKRHMAMTKIAMVHDRNDRSLGGPRRSQAPAARPGRRSEPGGHRRQVSDVTDV